MPEQEPNKITAASTALNQIALKIDQLGFGEDVLLLYASSTSMAEITRLINAKLKEEGSKHHITVSTVWRYIKQQPKEWLEEIKRIRKEILITQIEEWEAQSLTVRKEVSNELGKLIEDELKTGKVTVRTKGGSDYERNMTLAEKKDLSNILLKKITVQESGERMAGLGAIKGSKTGVDVNIHLDFLHDLRGKLNKKMKDGAVDVEYEDVE